MEGGFQRVLEQDVKIPFFVLDGLGAALLEGRQ